VPSAGPSDLRSIPLFASLSEAELAELAARFEVRDVGPGERLVVEGAPGFLFFVISTGEVAITSLGEQIASLGPGEFFGEMALADRGAHGRHVATATTTTQSRVLVLFSADFERLQTDHPRVGARIEAEMRERLEDLP